MAKVRRLRITDRPAAVMRLEIDGVDRRHPHRMRAVIDIDRFARQIWWRAGAQTARHGASDAV
jgi:hypothetical protein